MFSEKYNSLLKDSEMTAIIRANDWSNTAVGAMDQWSVGLRSALGIILNSKFPMFLFWGKDLTCFYNDACLDSMGTRGKHSSILGKPHAGSLSELWHIIAPIIHQVSKSGEASWHEDQWIPILRNGKMENSYWTSSYSAVCDDLEKIEGILVTMNDVTDKVAARKKMEEAEERARLAAEIAQIATWDLDLQTHKMIHSESLATIFGHQKNVQLTYADIISQFHPDDIVNVIEKAFELSMQSGIYKYEARVIKNNGELGWIRSHGKIFFDSNNEPLKIIGTLIDITEERNHSDILMESELKFRLLADSLPQLIWTADANGTLNYFNLSVLTYVGINYCDLNAVGFQKLIHPDEIEQFNRNWASVLITGNDFLLEHRILRQDGEYRWYYTRAIAQKDATGKIQKWVGTSTDIQQQKTFTEELEKEVNERTAELKNTNINLVKMNIELQSFVYVSSHDLQEPLRKIQTFISRLNDTEEMKFSLVAKEYFERIDAAADRMQSLIQDLLAYSRTNLTDKVFVVKNLQELVEEIKEDYIETIQETNAIIEIHNLCEARVIPFQFRQLFNNLIGNALKYAKPDIPPHIVINGSRISGAEIKNLGAKVDCMYSHISIADNGIGFDMEYKDKIFQIFQRLHSETEYSGTGIGLAIVKKIVENHSGIITASGTENQGAIFDIYIPEPIQN